MNTKVKNKKNIQISAVGEQQSSTYSNSAEELVVGKQFLELAETKQQKNCVQSKKTKSLVKVQKNDKKLQKNTSLLKNTIKNNENFEEYTDNLDLPTSKETKFEEDLLGNGANRSVLQNMRLNEAGRVVASIKQNQIDAYDELESYKRLLKRRRKRLIARILTFFILLIVAPVIIFFGTIIIDHNSRHDFFGYTFYIVITDSMEPEIMVNDCVVLHTIDSTDDLVVGDDIGYINDNGEVVVHRIETIRISESGQTTYKLKGINNNTADPKYVEFDQVVGKRVATLSALGNAVVFFRSIPGIIVFVILFLSIIVAFYVVFSFSENIKYIENVEK